jgi:hypothetical protein
MTRAYFLDTIIPSIYDSLDGAHPHDLAVLFSVAAMTALFDETAIADAQRALSPIDYHETSYACLIAGNLYTDVTLASLIALHLIGSFMINSGDRRLQDGIFSVVGLAMRLAIVAGYHRGERFEARADR